MFSAPGETSRTQQLSIRSDIHACFQSGTAQALLQEARSHLLIALSLYKGRGTEDRQNSKYEYVFHFSGRQTALSDIVGGVQNNDKAVSLLDMLVTPKQINTANLTNIIFRLSNASQPTQGFPPLKKASQTNIQNAMMLLFEAMRKEHIFPATQLDVSIQIMAALAKIIDKEKIQHLLCQHPDLIKKIHGSDKHKQILKSTDAPLLQEIEFLHQKLFPTQGDFLSSRVSSTQPYFTNAWREPSETIINEAEKVFGLK